MKEIVPTPERSMLHMVLLLILTLAACSPADDPSPVDATDTTGFNWDTPPTDDGEEPDLTTPDGAIPDGSPDLAAPDSAPDLVAPCNPGEGCFLDPCEENSDCLSGWCVQHMGGDVCTQTCTEECPPGWSCKQVGASDPDVVFICVSDMANLCRPCWSVEHCESVGGAADVCVDYGPAIGGFCGGACKDDGDCPGGYTCVDTKTTDGIPVRQCVNDAGDCPCTDASVALALWTPCSIENAAGACPGKRICTAEGLTACDAQTPVVEECNGANDDCDALTDEDTCDDGNTCTQDSCTGYTGCSHLPLTAVACSDGDACTLDDYCTAGICAGQLLDCDDGDPCTADGCVEGQCTHAPVDAACSDGNACTIGDQCDQGVCVPGEPMTCQDLNPCTDDSCDPVLGCQYTPNTAPCDDGDYCSEDDQCQGGVCVGVGGGDCDDGDPCTQDFCDIQGGCVNEPIVPCCGNGITEGPGEECDDGDLIPGDGCDSSCQIEEGTCFQDWLVGTPCNGIDYGSGCVPSDTGYHFVGIYDGYACFWHHKNQAWNTTQDSNYYHLALHFGVTPGTGKVSWCHDKSSTPTPLSYTSGSYFSISNVGAWGWCAESDPDSVGFVCIPAEGQPACSEGGPGI